MYRSAPWALMGPGDRNTSTTLNTQDVRHAR